MRRSIDYFGSFGIGQITLEPIRIAKSRGHSTSCEKERSIHRYVPQSRMGVSCGTAACRVFVLVKTVIDVFFIAQRFNRCPDTDAACNEALEFQSKGSRRDHINVKRSTKVDIDQKRTW